MNLDENTVKRWFTQFETEQSSRNITKSAEHRRQAPRLLRDAYVHSASTRGALGITQTMICLSRTLVKKYALSLGVYFANALITAAAKT